jgi:Tol biopolymer transport system component
VRLVALLVLSGCTSIFGLDTPRLHDAAATDAEGAGDAAIPDAVPDASVAGWSAPQVSLSVNANVDDPSLTDDLLEMYFNRELEIFVVRRATPTSPWGVPQRVTEISAAGVETVPSVSHDGLTLTFSTNRTGSMGYDIWGTTRPNRQSLWAAPVNLPGINSATFDYPGSVTADLLQFVFTSDRGGDFDIYITTRANADPTTPWSAPVAIGALNSPAHERSAFITADGSEIYFDSARGTSRDIYVSRRLVLGWSAPELVPNVNSAADDTDPWLSADGRTLYLASSRDGTVRIYSATR